jgi:predicted AlkP superfamily pyrophosphatase or phosphodiesterase
MKTASLLAAALSLAGCAYPYMPPALGPVSRPAGPATGALAAAEARAPVTLLIGIDGFRPDYLGRGASPVLDRLAAEGVTGPMRPSFPSKTFPNFWTLVTGMVPDRHGIVANRMEDAARPGETFTMASDDPFWWNAAEPIWVTAEKAGIRTATQFWPGSNVAWGAPPPPPNQQSVGEKPVGGTRPTDWLQYNEAIGPEQRVRTVIDWLRRPAESRPRLVTLYFEEVDSAGHAHGPDAPETMAAVSEVDRAMATLLAELERLGQPVNLVIVADHGMAATSTERVIALDRIVPESDARLVEYGPYASFAPLPGRDGAVAAALLRPHPHMRCWRKAAIPAALRYGTNPRVPPYLCLAEVGWQTARTAPTTPGSGGNHGYDNAAPEMRALFIANGPAFARGKRIDVFDNTAVAPLLRRLLALPAGTGLDGSDAPFRSVVADGSR